MRSRVRVRAAEEGGSWLRSWTIVGAVFLMFAAAVLLGACGGEEAASGGEEGAGNEVAFSDFDADDSGDLNDSEFATGVYNEWDTNSDEVLSEEEFNSGTEAGTFGDASEYGEFSEWDADGNGEIGEEEFDESFADTGVYDDWDADNNDLIDENEFNEAAV